MLLNYAFGYLIVRIINNSKLGSKLSIVDFSSSQCWDFLQKNQVNSYLIDVRSKEEWQETGIPDLSSLKNNTKLISWLFFTPSIHKNDNFIEKLNHDIPDKKVNLIFICKSGGRSRQAAEAASNNGYENIFNINDGFEGNMFDENLINLKQNGWLYSNLPRRNYE